MEFSTVPLVGSDHWSSAGADAGDVSPALGRVYRKLQKVGTWLRDDCGWHPFVYLLEYGEKDVPTFWGVL